MEFIALLLLAPLVFSPAQSDVQTVGPVAVVATIERTANETSILPPDDRRYTLTVLRHVKTGRLPAGQLATSEAVQSQTGHSPEIMEIVVSAP